MMLASGVRSPVPVTVTRREPEPLTVPAMTFPPSTFATGTDSPVIIDSFTSLLPLCTMPSAGRLPPGRTQDEVPLPERRDLHIFDGLADECVAPCWAEAAPARAGHRMPARSNASRSSDRAA